ncbi:hypothetical protein ECZU29_32270 [Escherichia coli]|nr:hypothetical protein ECZU29_32270 [Escherichia coli]
MEVAQVRHRAGEMNRADMAGIQVTIEHQRQVAEFKQRLLCPADGSHQKIVARQQQAVAGSIIRLFPGTTAIAIETSFGPLLSKVISILSVRPSATNSPMATIRAQ